MSKASGSNSKTFRETLTIWPHRSLSPRGFLVVMGSLGLLAFCIGLGFFLLGAWPVIGFLGLELLVVWGAFKLNYRAARRRQHVTATAAKLKIENVSPQGRRDTTELPTAWVRVELTPRDEPESHSRQRRKVLVRSHGRTAEIGNFLHPAETPKLASEVGQMVERARAAALRDDEPVAVDVVEPGR
ncbi:MAG: DUF2244 domain-containing protein [Candidatus Puniceispirillaceae bacterium]